MERINLLAGRTLPVYFLTQIKSLDLQYLRVHSLVMGL
jgi:hypothetical protein